MESDISQLGATHVTDVRAINRNLIEKALRMRCASYLAEIKSRLLTETIYEVDRSKKVLRDRLAELREQRELGRAQRLELEQRNAELEEMRRTLELRVRERTAELEAANVQLRRHIEERATAEKEREALRAQFYHAQKMESVGRLAGGVAHDFNNLLSAIIGYSELALAQSDLGPGLAEDLRLVLDAGNRAAVLTRQLLALSRRQVLDAKVVALSEVVEGVAKLLRRTIGPSIEVELHLAPDTGNVKADVGQLEQVLMNLAVNARDAMPRGGRLIIETHNVTLDEAYSRAHEGVRCGEYLALVVSDTGEGMPKEVAERIFEPFFTTKAAGMGTGLGLATVHGIITQHQGYIHVYSEPGQGTSFRIYLPRSLRSSQPAGAEMATAMPHGDETVLIVDDDDSIRRLVRDTLEPLGYEVLEADGPERAFEVAAGCSRGVALLLADLALRGASGRELISEFVRRFPSAAAVLISGFTDGAGLPQLNDSIPFVPKPLAPSRLSVVVRQVLDGGRR